MTEDIFAKQSYGQIALKKIKPANPNFRLYSAGWLETGGPPETWDVMAITGAEFRVAKTGPRKGQLSVIVPNTKRTVHVTRDEMRAFERKSQLTQYKRRSPRNAPVNNYRKPDA
ncbi:hypothetical protein [Burkholderia gladioli]|uniref:hypothetical protein n=1 Tax=Burkholderia gladioli TaxID=28095 RepID=UPI002152B479|nr:hypothetical protein [Burkholderia gladioli]